MVGDSKVGKSSFLSRYTENYFIEKYTPTTGIGYRNKTISLRRKNIKLQMIDTPGGKKYRTITQTYLKDIMQL